MPEISVENLMRSQTLFLELLVSLVSAGCMDAGGTAASSTSTGGYVGNVGGSGNPTSTTGGDSSNGGSNEAGGSTSSTGTPGNTGGSATTGTGPATNYYGYLPVPSSQNTSNFDPSSWYSSWKTKFYQDCGNGTARIAANVGDNQTFSEGIGYGMLMAVANGDRDAFDKLWAYYKAHEDANGLMNWKINACTTEVWGQYAATDGDEDAAMALVQADAQWGGYKSDATKLITAIKTYETSQTTTPTYVRPGDAANNGGKGEGVVNPSYFAIGYWHVWATYTGDASWNKLATDAYAMLKSYQTLTISNSTGALVPDWGNSAGQNPNGSGYYYDACRTPWRVAVDYAWFGTAEAQTFLTNVSQFVDSKGGIANVPFDKNSAFFGAFALSGMAVSQAKADAYINSWLSASMDDTPYFQGSLRGVYLLLANHKFPRGI